jgi:hypothetical protein
LPTSLPLGKLIKSISISPPIRPRRRVCF